MPEPLWIALLLVAGYALALTEEAINRRRRRKRHAAFLAARRALIDAGNAMFDGETAGDFVRLRKASADYCAALDGLSLDDRMALDA